MASNEFSTPGMVGMLWKSLAAGVLHLAVPMAPYENLAAAVRNASGMRAEHFSYEKKCQLDALGCHVSDYNAHIVIVTINKRDIAGSHL